MRGESRPISRFANHGESGSWAAFFISETHKENAIVEVRRTHRREKSMIPVVESSKQLKGGDSLTEYIHSGQSLLVEEIQNG